MKAVLLFCFIGIAAASFYDAVLDHHRDETVEAFRRGLDSAPHLRDVLGAEYSDEIEEVEDDIKKELVHKLKDHLDRVLEKIKDALDHGHQVSKNLLDQANELKEKLKALGEEAKGKLGELWEKVKDRFKELLDKVTGRQRRDLKDIIDALLNKLNLKETLEAIRQKLIEHLDVDKLRAYLEEKLGNSDLGRRLLDSLDKHGLPALRNLVDRLIGLLGGDRQVRAAAEVIDRLKEILGDVRGKVKEHFGAFVEWLKTIWNKGVDHAKDKLAALKEIAQEVAKHANELRDEVKRQAIEILEPFKNQLGESWKNMIDAIRGSLNKEKTF